MPQPPHPAGGRHRPPPPAPGRHRAPRHQSAYLAVFLWAVFAAGFILLMFLIWQDT